VLRFLAIPDATNWAWYPFVIFNSTQGFTIFLAFLLNKKAFKRYIDLFSCKKKVVSSSGNERPSHVIFQASHAAL